MIGDAAETVEVRLAQVQKIAARDFTAQSSSCHRRLHTNWASASTVE